MMNRLIRLLCVIGIAWTMVLVAAPQVGVQVAHAQESEQEDGLGTPPADIETPPDQIETSDSLPWGWIIALIVAAIVVAVVLWRFTRGSERRIEPPDDDRSGGLPPANPPQ